MTDRHVRIEFFGGDLDGRTLDSESADPYEHTMIESCLWLTKNGQVGKAFRGVPWSVLERLHKGELNSRDINPKASPAVYTVVGREETDDILTIRLRHSLLTR